MERVIEPGRIGACLLLLLAGCSTELRHTQSTQKSAANPGARPKSISTEVERVSEGPRLAPPPPPIVEASAGDTTTLEEPWTSLNAWARGQGYGALHEVEGTASSAYQLSATNHTLEVRANSLIANWDGVEFLLGFAPQLHNGELYLHELDLEKNVKPLLDGIPQPVKPDRVVVLDPGHGGQNTGTTSVLDGSPEKQYTLDWAARLASVLATNGCRVYLTRTNDTDVSLAERVAFAEAHGADLFISLHFNSAAPNRDLSGLETFCLTPSGMPSTLTRDYEDNPELVFTNNACDAENLAYALRLQGSLLQRVGMPDRGVRRARFMGVLRGQSCPAVLIEGGYLSNPEEARHIADPAYRQKLAEAVAAAIPSRPAPAMESAQIAAQTWTHTPTNTDMSPSNPGESTPQTR
jgi:N-acetylmuramoyl-L-alanine amidase